MLVQIIDDCNFKLILKLQAIDQLRQKNMVTFQTYSYQPNRGRDI